MTFILPWIYFLKLRVVTSCFQPIKKQWLSVTSLAFIHLDSFLTKLKKYIGSRESLFRIRRKDTSAVSSSPTMLGKRVSCIFFCVKTPTPSINWILPSFVGEGTWTVPSQLNYSAVNHWRIGPVGEQLKTKKKTKKRIGYLKSASAAVAEVCCLYLHLSKRRLCLVVCCYSSIWLLIATCN